MSRREITRRRLLQQTGGLAGLAVLGGAAGCQNPLGGGSGGGGGSRARIGLVPAGSDYALNVGVSTLLSNGTIRQRANDMLARLASRQFSDGPRTVEGWLDRIETQVGLDPRGLRELLLFGQFQSAERSGIVAWTEWTEQQLKSTLQKSGRVRETTYAGKTVYANQAPASEEWLATLAPGTFAAGAKPIVQATIDLWADNGSAVTGDVREAFTSASRGMIRFGFDVPTAVMPSQSTGTLDLGAFRNLVYGYGSLIGGTGGVVFTVNLRAQDQTAATRVRRLLQTGKTMFRQRIGQTDSQMAGLVRRVVDATSIGQQGRTVVVRNPNGADAVAVLLGGVVGAFVLGLGEQASDTVPQATFSFDYVGDERTLTITHAGGATISADKLYVADAGGIRGSWRELGATSSEVAAGDAITVRNVPPDAVIRVVWRSQGNSAVLQEWRGPDA